MRAATSRSKVFLGVPKGPKMPPKGPERLQSAPKRTAKPPQGRMGGGPLSPLWVDTANSRQEGPTLTDFDRF